MVRSIIRVAIVSVIVLGLITVGACRNADKPAERTQVVVVGSGMAGLMSALSLAEKGINVILLEKEDVVGGRLYSVVFDGFVCNMGAQYFFDGIHPVVDSYVKSFDVQPIDKLGIFWKGKFYKSKENEKDFPIPGELEGEMALAYKQLNIDYKLAGKGKEWFFDIEPKNDLWNKLEKMSCAEYLAKFPADVYDLINTELGAETGGDIKYLSAVVLVGWDGDENQRKFILKGGNQALAEKMKEDFIKAGGKVFLNSEVTKIKQSEDSVNVECKDGQEFASDYVVVATTANVATDIVKGLPTEKISVLSEAVYGPIAQIGLHLKNFPTGEKLSAALCVKGDITGYLNQTGSVVGNPAEGTIISVTVSDLDVLKLDDKALLERIGGALKKIDPVFNPETDILSYKIKRWKRAVPTWRPGYASKNQEALRKPVGRIFFAGDYTGDPSLMGAAWSGSRAAEQILDNIKNEKASPTG